VLGHLLSLQRAGRKARSESALGNATADERCIRRQHLPERDVGARERLLSGLTGGSALSASDPFGDDPAVRRRDGPDRARDERSVAIAIVRTE
jgi:hypothetical protein